MPSVEVVNKTAPSEPDEIVEFVQKNNCVVIGSPRYNPATEVVLSRHFGAEPFGPEADNRSKVPVRFVFKKGDQNFKNCATVEPWSPSRSKGSGLDICNRKGTELVTEVDWWPTRVYRTRTIRGGRDCGLVFS